MDEASEKQFFLTETIAFARTLPLAQARRYLHGLLLILGDGPESHEIRSAFVHLDESDRQLELLTRLSLTNSSRR